MSSKELHRAQEASAQTNAKLSSEPETAVAPGK